MIAGSNATIKTDVVESDIPLLLFKIAMKKAKMKINLEKDRCEIFGKEVELMTTSSGHYCVPLLSEVNKEEDGIAWVLAVDLVSLPRVEQLQSMNKLHKQMGQNSKDKFFNLLKDANAWYFEAEENLTELT